MPASSAAVSVIILNVDPGGWRSVAAIPANARTWPLGLMAAAPPRRFPSVATADFCRSGSIVLRTFSPGVGAERESGRLPASRTPPGLPASCSLSASSRPEMPTWASAGKPSGRRRARSIAPAHAHLADDARGLGERGRPGRAGGERRPVAGEDVGPLGQPGPAGQALARLEAREDEVALPGDPRAVAVALERQLHRADDDRPTRACARARARVTTPSWGSGALPVVSPSAVAVAAAVR